MPAARWYSALDNETRCSQLQTSHVACTSIVISSPPDRAVSCIPTPHVSHPNTFLHHTTRAALASPQSPAPFLHQPLSLSPCATSAPLDTRPTTIPPRCCKNPTKRLAGTPPTLLAQTSRFGVIPATLPNSWPTRRIRYKSSSEVRSTARFWGTLRRSPH